MNKETEQRNIKIEHLILDVNNPRFAELYSKSDAEDDLITNQYSAISHINQ